VQINVVILGRGSNFLSEKKELFLSLSGSQMVFVEGTNVLTTYKAFISLNWYSATKIYYLGSPVFCHFCVKLPLQ
jgi:hypothetical protein